MIVPPAFFTAQRQEYDMLDLEQLGNLAVKLHLHSDPNIKQLFSNMVEIAGTPLFVIKSSELLQYLIGYSHLKEYNNEYQHFYDLHPTAQTFFQDSHN